MPAVDVYQAEPGDMEDWDEREIELVVQEGRRQLDRQRNDLEGVRNRSQFLFTTCIGLLAITLAGYGIVLSTGGPSLLPWLFVILVLSFTSIVAGLLGAASVIVARKEMGGIDTALLSQQEPPVQHTLARSYARTVRHGENTIATQITVYRDAVLLVLIGAICYGVAWLVAIR
jgi:hypothetical protein